jgi:serine/threonine-protein kinase
MSSNPIGQVLLKQFRVDAFVASGGMGAVYRVWDLKRGTVLAMKVLSTDLADDPAALAPFKREANALKNLAHPHIVPFYGLHQTKDLVFLLVQYIDGPSLKDILKQQGRRPLDTLRVLTYLKATTSALGYAHAGGVIHCDVKPANVLVDRGGTVYLTDFGIARHAESTETSLLKGAGTLPYMSPEQCLSQPVTPATDVYALGVLLYEMLTGARPFRGNEPGTDPAATTGERLRYAHIHLPPPDPRRIAPALPAPLAEVILTALAKSPTERYHSTHALFEAACAALGVSPDNVPDRLALTGFDMPPAETPPSAGPAPRHAIPPAVVVTAGMVVVIALIAFVVVAGHLGRTVIATAAPAQTAETGGSAPLAKQQPEKAPPDSNQVTIKQQVNPKDGATMVFVPSGAFIMGLSAQQVDFFRQLCGTCPNDSTSFDVSQPAHQASTGAFWIYRTEVTNGLYQKCVAAGSCSPPHRTISNKIENYYGAGAYDDYPVVNVDWNDAYQYCQWAAGRLPGEMEWEKAARGTDRRLYPWGDQPPSPDLANVGEYDQFETGDSVQVGLYPKGISPYGALDMAGNVWEWVNDWYQQGVRRSGRGGSWYWDADNAASGYRDWWQPNEWGNGVGFRCAVDAP